jgi:type II restriction enzyme
LWAKYCDILLSKTWNYLGIQSQVIRARGNAADVMGTTPEYTIVGDAKAFRLSRTAKNQKDFKVSALDVGDAAIPLRVW